MKVERLIIFCSETEPDLDQVRATLQEALAPLDVSRVELRQEAGPESLAHAGWTALGLTIPGEGPGTLSTVRERLERLAETFSKRLGEDVLCIYVEPTHRQSRACLQSPSGFPRSSDGDSFHVLRQAATWVETDPVQLLRFFSATPTDLEAEQDEDDRFVDGKLRHARELMGQYLRSRK